MTTTTKNTLHVVLGATGSLGTNLVLELTKQGKNTVAVVRNAKKAKNRFQSVNVEIRQANLMDREQIQNAISGASFVYHCAGLPYTQWMKLFPLLNQNILAAVKQENAVLVYSDNLYMYGKMQGESIDERHPISKESKKGYLRYKLAENILKEHESGSIRAVIARAGDFYGPYVENGFCTPLFLNPLKGKSASWIGNEDQPHSLIFIKDMTVAMIKLAENPDTYGSIWHIPGGKPITGKNFVSLIESELQDGIVSLKILDIGMIRFLGFFIPVVRELRELAFEWKYPFIINASKFQERFPEFTPTTHEIAIAETLEWFKQKL